MRTDAIVYGPGTPTEGNYYYDGTEFQYGYILNDSDDAIGFGFQIDKTATISGVGVYIIDIVGTPNYKMGIVTISSYAGAEEAKPSNTLYNNATWQDFDPIVVGSGWSWIDLATPINATKGDFVAMVITPSGVTVPNASNYIEVNDESNLWSTSPGRFRYGTYWSRYEWISPAALKYTDGSFLGYPVISPYWELYSSPAERGLEFQLPIGATCVGAVICHYLGDYDTPFKVILANSSDTELASLTVTAGDIVGSYNGYYGYISWDTSNNPALNANTTYRLYIKPTTADTIPAAGVIMVDDDHKTMLPGGNNWKTIERSTPASGWTYPTGGYPWLSLLLTDLSGGEGNGGGGEPTDEAAYGFVG